MARQCVFSRTAENISTVTNSTSKDSKSDVFSYTSITLSTFEVLEPKETYNVNDTLRILITARDTNNKLKSSKGDYFRVKLFSKATKSSVGFDVSNYLGNGQYLAEATLKWPGYVQVFVRLVHPREAVHVLERIRDIEPGRVVFAGRFLGIGNGTKKLTEDVMCVPLVIREGPVCNYTDERSGYPLYCVRPSNPGLSCEDWRLYTTDNTKSTKYTMGAITLKEQEYFSSHKKLLTSSHVVVKVVGDMTDWRNNLTRYEESLPGCQPGQHLKNTIPSGFFHNDVWYSDQCRIRRFNAESTLACLSHKSVRIFGDSTARQFYIFFTSAHPSLKGNIPIDTTQSIVGPLIAKDLQNNITMTFNFHGHPARPSKFLRRDPVHYVVNRLNDLEVDDYTIILLSIGTHFTIYSLEMYERRMRDIKAAIKRLHAKSPNTLVVIKSANTREYAHIVHVLQNSEWYIKTIDEKMREIFADYPRVGFIDAWDVTVSQNFPDGVHPSPKVLRSLTDNFLSFICP
ncbi:NXPE family member 3-like [Diadema antillarum]|uniref:NXPE family member 3-like n=1 Tax=Diadema antillarum TaxID=105358 RepID=UPI003A8A451E